jgi:signal peptidase I
MESKVMPDSGGRRQKQPPNLFYRGSSMKGTFKPGDKLIIEKIPFSRIQKGDLIIFGRAADEISDFIVHRVADIASDGLVTRGDSCRDRDSDPVLEENVIGRVMQYDRKGKIHKARNGWAGRLRAMMLHGRQQPLGAAKLIFRRPYRMIRATGFVARFWRPEIETILFKTPQGPLAKYVHEQKTVATCWIERNRWWIKRPYDLIIRPELERRLPGRSARAEDRLPSPQD